MIANQVLPIAEHWRGRLDNLISKSHTDYIDVNQSVDWSVPVDRTRFPKRQDHCWVYGTTHWQRMNDAQRLEMAWEETARDISMFIWLEQALPLLYLSYVAKYGRQLDPAVREYLMLFSKEEIVHTLMFRRYMASANLTLFGPPDGLQEFFSDTLRGMDPALGVIATLLLENVAEQGAVLGTIGDGNDALTRTIALTHHHEEARHLAFGRWIAESHLKQHGRSAADTMRPILETYMSRLVRQYTFNTEIIGRLSFDLGVSAEDEDAVLQLRKSGNNRKINEERYGGMLAWLKKWSLVSPDYEWL
jgi:hypothetical protein